MDCVRSVSVNHRMQTEKLGSARLHFSHEADSTTEMFFFLSLKLKSSFSNITQASHVSFNNEEFLNVPKNIQTFGCLLHECFYSQSCRSTQHHCWVCWVRVALKINLRHIVYLICSAHFVLRLIPTCTVQLFSGNL